MKITTVISIIWAVLVFSPDGFAQPQRSCVADLTNHSYANESIAYELNNFLGSYELRFQVFADRTQVLLLNSHFSSNALRMEKIVHLVIFNLFGQAPSTDSSLSHRWLNLPGDRVKAKIPLIVQRLNEIPDANPLVAMSLIFTPGLSQIIAWKSEVNPTNHLLFTGKFQNTWANFVSSLKVHELIYLNHMGGKFFSAHEFPETPELDTIIGFVYGSQTRGSDVLFKLQQRWHRRLTLNFGPEEILPEGRDLLRRIFHWRAEPSVRPLTATVHPIPETKVLPPTELPLLVTNLNSEKEKRFFDSIEGAEAPIGPDLKLQDLAISTDLKSKLRQLPIEFAFEIGKYSAKQLTEMTGLNRREFGELLPELTVHGIHIYIDAQWDHQNFQLLRRHPEFRAQTAF